jgi:peptide/nickel transport system permease protein
VIRFIARRVLSGLLLLLAISVFSYTLLYITGDQIARRILGQNATQDVVDRLTVELGLDRPLVTQYLDWLSHAIQGDFGRSWFSGQVVTEGIANRLAVTLSIVAGATILAAIVSIVIGVLAAVRGGWVDRAVQVTSVLCFAIPGFLIALALVLTFSINLGWFKATGYIPIEKSFVGWISSVTLPIIALSAAVTAAVAQQVRGSVIDALQRDYVRTLRSRGLAMNSVILKHILRNAGGPALAVLAVQFVGLLSGAVIVEQIFALPGIGQMAVQATSAGDIPIVMGLVMVTAIIVVIVNLVIDLTQAALNPKVRLS